MKKIIHSHREIYGKAYGIWVIIALLYFFIMGAVWFLVPLIQLGFFNYWPLLMMAVFLVQLFYRRKIVNMVLGILGMFFSIIQLLNSSKNYETLPAYRDTMIWVMILFSIAILMAGILLFSFLQAFKQDEKTN